MAQLVKCWLLKRQDLSFNPNIHVKIPSAGEMEIGGPRGLWAIRLVKLFRFGFSERPVSKKNKSGERLRKSLDINL